jgi:hypothetical protein
MIYKSLGWIMSMTTYVHNGPIDHAGVNSIFEDSGHTHPKVSLMGKE